jgi:hypothetical protein
MKFNELHQHLFEETYEREEKSEELSDDTKDEILKFFAANPDPTDTQFHGWAESEDVDVHKAEEYAYELAHKFALFQTGGRWNETGEPEADSKELEMGIQVEYEHTSDKETAKRIALDHLAEFPDYYTRLAKMEREGKRAHNKENPKETADEEY